MENEKKDQELIDIIRRLPDAPIDNMFVSEAMARYDRARAIPLSPLAPSHLSIGAKLRVLFGYGTVKTMVLGVAFLLLGCFLMSLNKELAPEYILPIVGCLPLLVGLFATAQQLLFGQRELMRSLRISLAWMVQARFLLMTACSMATTLFVLCGGFLPITGSLWRVMLMWCVPTFCNAAAALLFCTYARKAWQALMALCALPMGWLSITTNSLLLEVIAKTDTRQIGVYALCALGALGVSMVLSSLNLSRWSMVNA